jgi:hypothetical protein
MARFIANDYALSVRKLRLTGATVRGTRDLLVSRGFQRERHPLLAARTAEGAPLWRKLDGSTSADERDAGVVVVDYYLHVDGGMVRVYPQGDPRGRIVPENAPAAIKSVLLRPPPPATTVEEDGEVRTAKLARMLLWFRNEAFRVSEDGLAIPKSRRAIYGLLFERKEPVESYRFAEVVHLTHVVTPLALDPVPEELP